MSVYYMVLNKFEYMLFQVYTLYTQVKVDVYKRENQTEESGEERG